VHLKAPLRLILPPITITLDTAPPLVVGVCRRGVVVLAVESGQQHPVFIDRFLLEERVEDLILRHLQPQLVVVH
jgi:hypothetical protein